MKVHAKRGSAAAAVVALLLTTLGTLVFPSTAGAAVVRAGGVTGVQVNGTGGGDGLSYVGLYELTDPVTGRRQATCIEWDVAPTISLAPSRWRADRRSDPVCAGVHGRQPERSVQGR